MERSIFLLKIFCYLSSELVTVMLPACKGVILEAETLMRRETHPIRKIWAIIIIK